MLLAEQQIPKQIACVANYRASMLSFSLFTAFLEGRLFSSQSELFENFSDCSDWLDNSRLSKKATFVLIM